MEKQCPANSGRSLGGVFFVSFFMGDELLPPTSFRKNENRKRLHRCRFIGFHQKTNCQNQRNSIPNHQKRQLESGFPLLERTSFRDEFEWV